MIDKLYLKIGGAFVVEGKEVICVWITNNACFDYAKFDSKREVFLTAGKLKTKIKRWLKTAKAKDILEFDGWKLKKIYFPTEILEAPVEYSNIHHRDER